MNLKSLSEAIARSDFPLEFPGQKIGSQWRKDKRAQKLSSSFNPSNGQKLVDVAISLPLLEEAISTADASQQILVEMGFTQRMRIVSQLRSLLVDYQDTVIKTLRIEAGKPKWEARADFDSALAQLDAILARGDEAETDLKSVFGFAQNLSELHLQPFGLVAAFIPLMTPFSAMIQAFTASMMSACPLVMISSTHASVASLFFACMLNELEDFPSEVVSVLFADYKTFLKALQDQRIKVVLYSGSREHCDAIRNESGLKLSRQLVLSSGGKNAVIVDETAELESAVKHSFDGLIKSAGQLNSSTSRVFVAKSIRSDFLELMATKIKNMKIGPSDEDDQVEMGPLYSQKAVDKFLRFETMAKREADETPVWGKALDLGGCFVQPGLHYIKSFDPDSAYQSNVLLCPDLVVYDYEDLDDACRMANLTNAPLAVSLMGDEGVLRSKLNKLKAPNILFNMPTAGSGGFLPIAGRQLSGAYRFGGASIALLMSYPQAVQGLKGV